MAEKRLFSSSEVKARLFGIKGITVADEQWIGKSIGKVEDEFYREEAKRQSVIQNREVRDGLLFPYLLDYDGFLIPLPIMVTLIKANEARNILTDHENLKRTIDSGIVNDAIWAVGDGVGNLTDAINKTDPNRNHGDVQRLGEFFSQQEGRYFYSVGSTASVNSETGNIDLTLGVLRVGKIKLHTISEFNEIFGVHLKAKGAFNLDFVLHEGLIVLPKKFQLVNHKVELNQQGLRFVDTIESQIRVGSDNITSLQMAAHGIL